MYYLLPVPGECYLGESYGPRPHKACSGPRWQDDLGKSQDKKTSKKEGLIGRV